MTPDPTAEEIGESAEFNLARAYSVDGPEANRALYAAWADTYESGFIAQSRYVYHHGVAEIFMAGFSSPDEPVLDVGCGTGLVGEQLHRLGLRVIDGVDISPEMLLKAKAKSGPDGSPMYRNLLEADLTTATTIAPGGYQGIVSAGAFTHGHLGPDSLGEVLQLARPGARCAIGINSAHFATAGFDEWLTAAVDRGVISALDLQQCEVYSEADPTDPNNIAQVAVFTTTG